MIKCCMSRIHNKTREAVKVAETEVQFEDVEEETK